MKQFLINLTNPKTWIDFVRGKSKKLFIYLSGQDKIQKAMKHVTYALSPGNFPALKRLYKSATGQTQYGTRYEIPDELIRSQQDVTLCIDALKVNGLWFLTTISRNIYYRTAHYLAHQTADIYYEAITDVI